MQSNELRMSKVLKIRCMCVLMGSILLKIKHDYFNITLLKQLYMLLWLVFRHTMYVMCPMMKVYDFEIDKIFKR